MSYTTQLAIPINLVKICDERLIKYYLRKMLQKRLNQQILRLKDLITISHQQLEHFAIVSRIIVSQALYVQW